MKRKNIRKIYFCPFRKTFLKKTQKRLFLVVASDQFTFYCQTFLKDELFRHMSSVLMIIKFLKEIVSLRFLAWHTTWFLRRSFEDGEIALKMFIKFKYGCHIATSVTVIWCAPDSQNCFVEMPLIAFHDKLKSTQE